jgi:hypothetical protein
MTTLEEAVERLRNGRPVSFLPTDTSRDETRQFVAVLERHVGLPLEKREFIDVRGFQIVVWVGRLCRNPLAETLLGDEVDGSYNA